MYYIYKITNIVNNKIYIGLTTVSINYRWFHTIKKEKRSGL